MRRALLALAVLLVTVLGATARPAHHRPYHHVRAAQPAKALTFHRYGAVLAPNTLSINQLPAASTPLGGSEIFPLMQNGVTRQTPLSAFAPYLTGALANQVAGLAITSLPHVANLAALQTYANFAYPVVRDDTGVTYSDTGTNCTQADGGFQVSAQAGHCWQAAAGTRWTPLVWGADPTGARDSTVQLQAFLTFVSTQHRDAFCPAGTYVFTQPLTTGTGNWSLTGPSSCRLQYQGASTTNNLISLQGPSDGAHVNGITITGPLLTSTTVMTAGAGVFVQYVDNSRIDMQVGDYYGQVRNLYNGIQYHRAFDNNLDGLAYASHYGVDFYDGVQLVLGARQLIVNGNGDTGIHAGGAWGGAYFDNVAESCIVHNDGNLYNYAQSDLSYMPVGLRIDNQESTTTNYQFFVSNLATFDSCSASEVFINDTGTLGGSPVGAGYHTFSFDGWASGSHGSGIPGIDVVSWANGSVQIGGGATIINNAGSGVLINDATARVTIDPAAWIGSNTNYGVQCAVATHNINSDAFWLTNGAAFGDYSPLCQGSQSKGVWINYTPTVTCTSSGGSLGTYTATGLFRTTGFTTTYQVEIKNTAAGSCTSLAYTLPVDATGQAKVPVTTFNIAGRDNANGNQTNSALGAGNTTALLTTTSGANLQTATSDNVVSGTYMNNTGQ